MHYGSDRLIATRRYADGGIPLADFVYARKDGSLYVIEAEDDHGPRAGGRVVEINDVFTYLQSVPWQMARTVIRGGKTSS